MFFILILILGFIIIVLVSIYCHEKKIKSPFLRSLNCKNSQNGNSYRGGRDNKQHIESKLKRDIRVFMDSLTFLTAKVTGYIPCHFLRNILYKYVFCISMGKDCVIYYGLEVRDPWNIILGEGTVLGDHTMLDARYGIKIGSNVNFSTGAWVYTLEHDVNSHSFSTENEGKPVFIADRAWISTRTIILPGCSVSEGDVLAAGAVLTKSIDEKFCIWGGVPAKKIGQRNQALNYVFTDNCCRFFL